MNKSLLFAISFGVVLGASCGKGHECELLDRRASNTSKQLTVVARISNPTDTKTIVQPDETSIYWTVGDAINLFYGGVDLGRFQTSISEPSDVAEFTGEVSTPIESLVPSNYWAIYPYNSANTCDGSGVTLTIPRLQRTIAGSFNDKLNPTVATSSELDMSFYNVGSWFIFSVTQEGVSSAEFRGNNNEDIVGTVRVTMDDSSHPVASVVEGCKSVRIVPADGDTFSVGKLYYIVVLPQTLSNGYTLTLYKDSQHVAECVVSKSATFSRSQYRRKRDADAGLSYSLPLSPVVDLGLSVLWANKNVGASSPEETGGLYAWGEIETKESYSWSNYKWGQKSNLTKYCLYNNEGYPDGRRYLEDEDDAASIFYGGDWRTPSPTNYRELVDFCTWVWDDVNGGYKITSNVEGYTDQSIFLPATEGHGCYWTDTCDGRNSASVCVFENDYIPSYDYAVSERCNGNRIRGIHEPEEERIIPVLDVRLSKDSFQIEKNNYKDLAVMITPSYATCTISITSSDNTVVSISGSNKDYRITGTAGGFSTLTVTVTNGNIEITKTCNVSVLEAVDLGLSVKWANINLGATSLIDHGDKYAWGETEIKESYSWSNYKWGTNPNHPTKYIRDSDYGIVDNKRTLDPEDDAAYVKLGGKWRIPTWSEVEELLDNCSASYQKPSNYKEWGYKMLSYNGKSIFLPQESYWVSDNVSDPEFAPAGYAWLFSFNEYYFDTNYDYLFTSREHGYYIRPVYAE